MPFLIETLFAFQGLGQGWTETFFWQSADGDLNNAENIVTPIAQARAKLLASPYMLTVVRDSQVLDASNNKVLRVTDIFEPNINGIQAWAASSPNLALMCLWQNPQNTAAKKQYMRGIPAGIGDLGKKPDFSFGAFESNFNAWRSKLLALPAGWVIHTPTQNLVISSYVTDPVTGQVTFTLSVPGGFAWPVPFGKPTAVYVKLPGKNPLDGKIVVIPTTTTSCFTQKAHPAAPLPMGQIGTMTLKSPSFTSIGGVNNQGATGQIHPQRIVTHKTGRPIYASRGRAANRVLW